MKLNPFRARPLIGLDIQPHGMRLVQLRQIKSSYLVEQAVFSPLPEGLFNEGKIKHWEIIREKLANIVHQLNIKGMIAAVVIPAGLVRMQQIHVPYGLPEIAIEAEIKVQLEKDFPGFSDTLLIDFNIVNMKESGYSGIFFVATRQEYVSQYVDCIRSAGLSVKIVDVDVYALKRVLAVASSQSQAEEVRSLICYINRVASLILFTSSEIISHHQWEVNDEDEFLPQLKSRINIFAATFPNKPLRRIAIYSNHHITQAINGSGLHQEFDFDYPNPLNTIRLNDQLLQSINAENISDFLLACGAAMCEVPRW